MTLNLSKRISIIANTETTMTPKEKIIQAIQQYRAVPGIDQAIKLENLLDYYVASETPRAYLLGDGSVRVINIEEVNLPTNGTVALYQLGVAR